MQVSAVGMHATKYIGGQRMYENHWVFKREVARAEVLHGCLWRARLMPNR